MAAGQSQTTTPIQSSYPGETASVDQLLRLADEFRQAAKLLLPCSRKGEPLSRAPFRLVAIHAIELYLSTLLLHAGNSPAAIRAMHHDLAARLAAAITSGLGLRKRTAEHLAALTANREYLVSRYGPELTQTASQINRLTATLQELGEKVGKIIRSAPPPTPAFVSSKTPPKGRNTSSPKRVPSR